MVCDAVCVVSFYHNLVCKEKDFKFDFKFLLVKWTLGWSFFPQMGLSTAQKESFSPLCSVFKVLKDTSTYIWIIHTKLSMILQPCNPLGLYLSLCSLSNCLLPSVKHIQNCYLQVHVCYKISDWLSITRFTQPCSSFQSFQCGCDTWHP